MQSFLYKWLWEGRRKWMMVVSVIALSMWLFAYYIFYYWVGTNCPARGDTCYDLWLHTIGRPFFAGYFLKTVILLPLLFLFPFSNLTFRIWAVFSAVLIPAAMYSIIAAPTYGQFFDKVMTSTAWGAFYAYGTLFIIIIVPLGEYLYKKFKMRNS